MIRACDKETDFYCGGAEKFQALEQDGRKFGLFSIVTITTNDDRNIKGEIIYISEIAVEIMPEHISVRTKFGSPTQVLKFKDIKHIK